MVSYKLQDYAFAERIVHDFSKDGAWLRSVIARATSGQYAESLPYSGLLREGYKIRGVAQKILKKREEIISRQGRSGLEEKQLGLFS